MENTPLVNSRQILANRTCDPKSVHDVETRTISQSIPQRIPSLVHAGDDRHPINRADLDVLAEMLKNQRLTPECRGHSRTSRPGGLLEDDRGSVFATDSPRNSHPRTLIKHRPPFKILSIGRIHHFLFKHRKSTSGAHRKKSDHRLSAGVFTPARSPVALGAMNEGSLGCLDVGFVAFPDLQRRLLDGPGK